MTAVNSGPDLMSQITKIWRQLPPAKQEHFLRLLAKHQKEHSVHGPQVWLKWRLWYRDDLKLNRTDFMFMFARTPGEAKDLANQCRHKKLQFLAIELVP